MLSVYVYLPAGSWHCDGWWWPAVHDVSLGVGALDTADWVPLAHRDVVGATVLLHTDSILQRCGPTRQLLVNMAAAEQP